MEQKLINNAVLRRLEKAESDGDVKLLEKHLQTNYDVIIHEEVYAALVRLGRETAKNKYKEYDSKSITPTLI